MTEFRKKGPSRPAPQIANIAALLKELEVLTDRATGVPAPLLRQTRITIEHTRRVLNDYVQLAQGVAPKDEGDGDPQPDVDNEILERMYRDLEAGCPFTGAATPARPLRRDRPFKS